jgi:hypothetical protein
VIAELVELWRTDDDYSHGILVPFFCAFLVWHRREQLKTVRIRGDAIGLPVILLGLAALVLGEPSCLAVERIARLYAAMMSRTSPTE